MFLALEMGAFLAPACQVHLCDPGFGTSPSCETMKTGHFPLGSSRRLSQHGGNDVQPNARHVQDPPSPHVRGGQVPNGHGNRPLGGGLVMRRCQKGGVGAGLKMFFVKNRKRN